MDGLSLAPTLDGLSLAPTLDGLSLAPTLWSTDALDWSTAKERNMLLTFEKQGWKNIRFGFQVGVNSGTLFADLPKNPAAAKVPKQYIAGTVNWGGYDILKSLETVPEEGKGERHGGVTTRTVSIDGGGIVKVEIGKYKDKNKAQFPALVRLTKENGEVKSFVDGVDPKDVDILTQTPPSGTKSLLGFWGSAGEAIDALGPIWL